MKKLPFTVLPGQEDRILRFLNRISSPAEITDSTLLKDDPFYNGTSDYTIGDKVASNLINAKENLPGGRFRHIEQLLDVEGIGDDKVRDLIHSFWQPASDFFKAQIQPGILLDNWKIECFSTSLSEDKFNNIVNTPSGVRNFIAEAVAKVVLQKQGKAAATLAQHFIHQAYMGRYESGELGSHAFALWWYHFDMDNWFSFDQMRTACALYLDYYTTLNNRLELHLVKGFPNGDVLAEAITTKDLPVVVNYGERCITFWAASLYD